MAKELSQPDQRRSGHFTDQHNREWFAPVDIRTGHAVGTFEPRFTAPWYPGSEYIRHDPKDARRVIIDYPRLIAERKDAMFEYEELRWRTAQDMYGAAFHKMLGDTYLNDPPELRRKIGAPPSEVAFPEAAHEGNRWVLGFSDVVPEWAKAVLERERLSRGGRRYLDADTAADLDEQYDPEATGGKIEKKGKKVAA